MAWRAPRYATLHAAREAGAAAISSTTEDTAFPHEHLIDDRAGSLFKFTASAANLQIDLDRGAGFAALDGIDRIYIPAGHNLSSTIDVLDDDAADFVGATTLLSAGAVPASGAVDLDITESTQRFIRVEFNGTGQWEIPQLILTKTEALARGPDPTGWNDDLVGNVLTLEKSSGAAAYFVQGADRRRFELEYHRVFDDGSDTDLTKLDQIVALGEAVPFLFDPPYDDEVALWVTLTRRSRRNDHPNPSGVSGKRRRYQIEVLEHLA